MKTPLVIAAFLSLATSADARIGERVAQIEARYGKPQRVLHERGSFRQLGYGYRGFMVAVAYVNGICKSEGFSRPGLSRLSDEDVQQLLALSLAPGTAWKRVRDEGGDPLWMRSDTKVVGLLSEHKVLQVQEKDFRQPKT
jgi:hypothetical protein